MLTLYSAPETEEQGKLDEASVFEVLTKSCIDL